MRLDKLLVQLNIGSRKEVKEIIRKGFIEVDNIIVKDPALNVDEYSICITYQNKEYRYSKYRYFMLNKPKNVVCANKDNLSRTVIDILKEQINDINVKDYFSMGRLDKDTLGLLILTNDGELSHRLLSPKFHVKKTYYVKLDLPLDDSMIESLENGVNLEENIVSKEAKVDLIENNLFECFLTITEGKFHQVKRMFNAVGNNVNYLKRVSFGGLNLDNSLLEGSIRELTEDEVKILKNNI